MSDLRGDDSTPSANLRTFLLHALAFVLPLITLAFWITAPHAPRAAALWLLPLAAMCCIDRFAPSERRQPASTIGDKPYDLQLYALFAIQLANNVLLLRATSQLDTSNIMQTATMLGVTQLLAGTNAAYSGTAIAHEFIHRRNIVEHTMGRLLLASVLYEHYATEHIRGHHPRVGTADDPVTAQFGETHWHFMRRTVPAQLLSAWHLENKRLGEMHTPWRSPKMLQHRVAQGLVFELALLVAILYFFGAIALAFFVVQALTSILMLETVNYIEHWGLRRTGKKVRPVDSWDTDNWFTLYTLVGLSRHADHHAQASRPYQKLRYYETTAKLPGGYYSTIIDALLRNGRFRARATAELQRKRLGPFALDDEEIPSALAS